MFCFENCSPYVPEPPFFRVVAAHSGGRPFAFRGCTRVFRDHSEVDVDGISAEPVPLSDVVTSGSEAQFCPRSSPRWHLPGLGIPYRCTPSSFFPLETAHGNQDAHHVALTILPNLRTIFIRAYEAGFRLHHFPFGLPSVAVITSATSK